MPIDLDAAERFMTTHARLLDRRRFALLTGAGGAGAVLDALEPYRNPDGGYGWGIEPDLRSPGSQPSGALHAFEVFADVAPVISARAVELCDWLGSVTLDDGGLPFALAVSDDAGVAPFWAQAETSEASLHITTAVVAEARRAARHDPGVASHDWLDRATRFCLDSIGSSPVSLTALELRYSLAFLDTVADTDPEAQAMLEALVGFIPESGTLPVEGGADDEMMRPLDFAPLPDRPVRALFDPAVIDQDLARLVGLQTEEGGWPVDFGSFSPVAALEWPGYHTVWAVQLLRANGVG